ncbi:unnamed protein product [Parascedosporium putredinis]|uniref:Secreted protein n=1 Tax=Parascedosporium putredinis TaxID=1442378 RepID=A0A9P1HC37_9PEZI|nr:unnamed protein product [Parascedosporium putredinis]CAI8004318.1 unnamed protein product [Parascedosporium putredinis]
MHKHEEWGAERLVAVVAAGVQSSKIVDIPELPEYEFVDTILDEESLVDITDSVVNNTLRWTAPTKFANYTLFAVYEKFTLQRSVDPIDHAAELIGNGSWITDHFSASGANLVIDFWDEHILGGEVNELIKKVGEHAWEDSMEMSSALWWSHGFLERFEANRGYSPRKYLPLLFHQSNTLRAQYRPYNTTYLLGSTDHGQHKALQDYRLTLSEGYHDVSAKELVNLFQESFAAGVNVMVVHGMPYGGEFMSTWPGYTPLLYSFDYNAGPRLPDWNYMDDHMAYAARNQLVLQTGTTKRDIAFYHYDEPRSVTEGYNFSDLRAAGFSYEYLVSANLASGRAAISNGVIAPDGPAYRALVFNEQTYISAAAASRVLTPASLRLSDNRNVSVHATKCGTGPSPFTIEEWNVQIQSWVPDVNKSSSRSMIQTIELGTLPELKPWSEISHVRNVSGVGVYQATFSMPKNYSRNMYASATMIHFGPILNTLRAWVNDRLLPPIDLADAEVEISKYLVEGENTIRIEVSSTLFNAVKARVDSLATMGSPVMFPSSYSDDVPFQEFGLVGPVMIRQLRKVTIRHPDQ